MQKTVNSFVCAVMRLGEKPQPKKISRADPRKIQESLTAWSNVKELSFHLAGHEDCMIADVMELLQCFVKAKAFPPLAGSSSPSGSLTLGALAPESAKAHALQVLRGIGAVEPFQDGPCEGSWVLNTSALCNLQHMHMAADLEDLGSEEILSGSTWELLTLLNHHGWQLKLAPRQAVKKRQLQPVLPESADRFWYCHQMQSTCIGTTCWLCSSQKTF